MKILIGYERSGTLRTRLLERGHECYSIDLKDSEHKQNHIVGCIWKTGILNQNWDLAIFHPPCQYLSNAGVQYLQNWNRLGNVWRACQNFNKLLNLPIKKFAIENPLQHYIARALIQKKPDQLIRPSDFGSKSSKRTNLWLKGLPPLISTIIEPKATDLTTCKRDPYKRSILDPKLAEAMINQWVV